MSDPRLGDLINKKNGKGKPAATLVGFPSDQGVITNGGRPGAAQAPGLIREWLFKLTPHFDYFKKHVSFLNRVADQGDMTCSGVVQNDQEKLGELVSGALQKNTIPVILGGGHETSFGHFLGYADARKPVSIINIDAHTDVRPLKDGKPHSGSPFYQSLEHPSSVCISYNIFGLNPASVAAEHLGFVRDRGQALFESETTVKKVVGALNRRSAESIMVTMDMDAVKQSEAPGVSAPNASGISKELWLELAFQFGSHPSVTSFDLCEVNPEYDRDHQTVRLAALTVWYFLLGVALRDE